MMIVNRRTLLVKKGCKPQAISLLKSAQWDRPIRIYTPAENIGPFDTLVLEADFDSLAEHVKYIEGRFQEKFITFDQKLSEFLVSGGGSEVWYLE